VKSSGYKPYHPDIAPVSFLPSSVLLLSLLFVFLSQLNYIHYFSVAGSAFSICDVQQNDQTDDDIPPAISHYVTASQSYSQQAYALFHPLELPKNNHVVLPGNRAPPVL